MLLFCERIVVRGPDLYFDYSFLLIPFTIQLSDYSLGPLIESDPPLSSSTNIKLFMYVKKGYIHSSFFPMLRLILVHFIVYFDDG